MADNSLLNSPTVVGGDTYRSVDKTGVKTQVVTLDMGGSGAEALVSGAVPVSATSLPLPTGAATAVKQDTGNTSIASVDTNQGAQADAETTGNGSLIAILKKCRTYLGQLAAQLLDFDTGAGTATTPTVGIVQPANGGPVAVSSSNPLNVVQASQPLPTGAATEAGHLAAIDTSTAKIPAQGQALAAASMPVVLTAIQVTTLTPPAAITGFATSAKQDTAQTALDAIKTDVDKIPSQGQAVAGSSMPVVLPAAQITTLTPPAAITGFATEAGNIATVAATLGATTGAKVITDSNGTIQQYLRGLVYLLITSGQAFITAVFTSYAKYGTNNQSITCTITSLANNGQRQATAIDNTTLKHKRAKVHVKIKSAGASTSSTGYANVYYYETADGGTTYGDTVTGTDGSVTLTSPPNLKLLGVINIVANSTTYNACFDTADVVSQLGDHWGIVIENKTGGAWDASVGSCWYQGCQEAAAA